MHAGKPSLSENPIKFFFAQMPAKDKAIFSKEKSPENKVEVLAREGETLLEVAHNNNIELEGACEASLACSTCHVILD